MNLKKDFILRQETVLLTLQLQSYIIWEDIKEENNKEKQVNKQIWFEVWKEICSEYIFDILKMKNLSSDILCITKIDDVKIPNGIDQSQSKIAFLLSVIFEPYFPIVFNYNELKRSYVMLEKEDTYFNQSVYKMKKNLLFQEMMYMNKKVFKPLSINVNIVKKLLNKIKSKLNITLKKDTYYYLEFYSKKLNNEVSFFSRKSRININKEIQNDILDIFQRRDSIQKYYNIPQPTILIPNITMMGNNIVTTNNNSIIAFSALLPFLDPDDKFLWELFAFVDNYNIQMSALFYLYCEIQNIEDDFEVSDFKKMLKKLDHLADSSARDKIIDIKSSPNVNTHAVKNIELTKERSIKMQNTLYEIIKKKEREKNRN